MKGFAEFADKGINGTEELKFVFRWIKNIVRIGNAGTSISSFSRSVFKRILSSRSLKGRIVWKRVKWHSKGVSLIQTNDRKAGTVEEDQAPPSRNIGLIHVLEVVNIHRGTKNGLTPECEARGC